MICTDDYTIRLLYPALAIRGTQLPIATRLVDLLLPMSYWPLKSRILTRLLQALAPVVPVGLPPLLRAKLSNPAFARGRSPLLYSCLQTSCDFRLCHQWPHRSLSISVGVFQTARPTSVHLRFHVAAARFNPMYLQHTTTLALRYCR